MSAVFLFILLFIRLKIFHRVLLFLICFLDCFSFQSRSTLFSSLPVSTKSNVGNAFKIYTTDSHINNSKLAKTSQVLTHLHPTKHCIWLYLSALIWQNLKASQTSFTQYFKCKGPKRTSVTNFSSTWCSQRGFLPLPMQLLPLIQMQIQQDCSTN